MTKKAVQMVNTNVLETKVTLVAALAFLASVGRTVGATQAEMVKNVTVGDTDNDNNPPCSGRGSSVCCIRTVQTATLSLYLCD
ncbi:MAG: uncharacterized protein KVP18_002006 [Porospora cf. gigantea A]|uniref:uncharacterized protein n=1 Tax=Porospora cf. gigantea A TaxID=2853593 RepID=UPI00355AA8E6|nr:MAG: hypothetical protein KVP18_002006 [Porospora cf. gigantea A]